jgi:hypothetical protein
MNREQWLELAVSELRPIFDLKGHALPEKIRVSCGFPSKNARSRLRRIGEHWSPDASSDGTHEILISPVLSDTLQVLGTLVHELCHAAHDGDGHGSKFSKAARDLWLEGKPTEATAGDRFKQNLTDLIDGLGAYPHAALNVGFEQKKQSTRLLKACCPSCGYTIRLTAKWVAVGLPECPVDGTELSV